jgi:hypothetical protein
MGMVARGDRDHDIAAWFGVNQGRIAEAKDGKFGTASAASTKDLPPKGPPGIKGRHLREVVEKAISVLESGGDPTSTLKAGRREYDEAEA